MTIEVTQQHIDDGKRTDASSCAVALALSSALGEKIMVSGVSFGYMDGRVQLPEDVQKWVTKFDLEGPTAVQPMSFELPIERRFWLQRLFSRWSF